MSYILEALKKSEYARQQGRLPDLVTLPNAAAAPAARAMDGRLILLGGALLALAVAGWWRAWQAAPVDPPRAPASPPALAAARSDSVPTPSATAPSGPAAAPPRAAALVEPPAGRHEPRPPSIALPPREVAARPLPPGAPPAPDAPSPTLPAAPDRVLSYHELPAPVRERIPPLSVSGFSHAERAELSLAVINERVLRQGESPAPGIVLERIASDGVVLSFAGYRFRPPR